MTDILHLQLWSKQQEIARAIHEPPFKVLVRASHSVGKTFLAAALTSYWFDVYPTDSAVITTAPTARDVKDLLWGEVRLQRRRAGVASNFVGESAPHMATAPDHFAKGFTANRGESFHGRHFRHMLFVFDESVGVSQIFWETTKSMFKADGDHSWVSICNPTDTSSQPYQEEQLANLDGSPAWRTISMSSLDHPNIIAALANKPPPFPNAVSLAQFESWIADWCDPVLPEEVDNEQQDFCWRGQWVRPGPLFLSRALGQWPTQGTYGVWSDAAWRLATRDDDWHPNLTTLPVIGCDPAAFGDDDTAIHVRWGPHSLSHERHNGWLEDQIAGRIKQLCQRESDRINALYPSGRAHCLPTDIPVNYDSCGRGGALASHRGDYKFIPINASHTAREKARYPNRRSELWFAAVRLARQGLLNLSAIPSDELGRIRQQAMSPRWKVNSAGQQEVEPKHETKKRLK